MLRRGLLQTGSLTGSVAAALTSVAASICCIGPLAIAILGVNGAILAAGIKPYRVPLLAASALLIGLAVWGVYVGKGARQASCSTRSGQLARAVLWFSAALWLAAVAIQFAADRYWL